MCFIDYKLFYIYSCNHYVTYFEREWCDKEHPRPAIDEFERRVGRNRKVFYDYKCLNCWEDEEKKERKDQKRKEKEERNSKKKEDHYRKEMIGPKQRWRDRFGIFRGSHNGKQRLPSVIDPDFSDANGLLDFAESPGLGDSEGLIDLVRKEVS